MNLAKKLKLLKTYKAIMLKRPFMSHLWVTNQCNMKCKFCYLPKYTGAVPSIHAIRARLDTIKELGCPIVVLMGGEPTLRRDLSSIIHLCKERGLISYLVTNGTLLNKELTDEYMDAGLDIISMSLSDLGTSGLVKYPCKFDLEEKLKLLHRMKKRILAFVAVVVTKINTRDAESIIEKAGEWDLPVTVTAMADCGMTGIRNPKNDEVMFTSDEDRVNMKMTFETIWDLTQHHHIVEPDAYFKRIIDDEPMQCAAGERFFDIDTDGFIKLCVLGHKMNYHYTQLNKENYKEIIAEPSKIIKKMCIEKCVLAAYFNTSYYAKHPFSAIRMIMKG